MSKLIVTFKGPYAEWSKPSHTEDTAGRAKLMPELIETEFFYDGSCIGPKNRERPFAQQLEEILPETKDAVPTLAILVFLAASIVELSGSEEEYQTTKLTSNGREFDGVRVLGAKSIAAQVLQANASNKDHLHLFFGDQSSVDQYVKEERLTDADPYALIRFCHPETKGCYCLTDESAANKGDALFIKDVTFRIRVVDGNELQEFEYSIEACSDPGKRKELMEICDVWITRLKRFCPGYAGPINFEFVPFREDNELSKQALTGLQRLISQKLKCDCDMRVAKSYGEIMEPDRKNRILFIGAMQYVYMRDYLDKKLEPLVTQSVRGNTTYSSMLLGNGVDKKVWSRIMQGKRQDNDPKFEFMLGEPLSTSGFLIPANWLHDAGLWHKEKITASKRTHSQQAAYVVSKKHVAHQIVVLDAGVLGADEVDPKKITNPFYFEIPIKIPNYVWVIDRDSGDFSAEDVAELVQLLGSFSNRCPTCSICPNCNPHDGASQSVQSAVTPEQAKNIAEWLSCEELTRADDHDFDSIRVQLRKAAEYGLYKKGDVSINSKLQERHPPKQPCPTAGAPSSQP